MKIKNDFITNSSSTSYILGDLRKNREKLEANIKYDFSDSVNIIKNEKELNELLDEYSEFLSNDEILECKEILKKDGVLYIINYDETIATLGNIKENISENIFDKGIKLIVCI